MKRRRAPCVSGQPDVHRDGASSLRAAADRFTGVCQVLRRRGFSCTTAFPCASSSAALPRVPSSGDRDKKKSPNRALNLQGLRCAASSLCGIEVERGDLGRVPPFG